MTHDAAAAILAVRGTTRVWESRRYQRQGSFALEDWAPWRAAVRDALGKGPATRAEIWEHVRSDHALAHLEVGASGAGSDSLFKPLHWWGDICFGPDRDGSTTFRLLDGDPLWTGALDLGTGRAAPGGCWPSRDEPQPRPGTVGHRSPNAPGRLAGFSLALMT